MGPTPAVNGYVGSHAAGSSPLAADPVEPPPADVAVPAVNATAPADA